MTLPKISIVVPCEPQGPIHKVLASIKNTTYPKNKIEFFIARGKNPSKQRNLAIERCTGEYIFFFDADTTVPKDHLTKVIQEYQNNLQVI